MEAGARTHQAPRMARKGCWTLRRSKPSLPRGGALRLSDYPGDAVHVVCDKCERRGLYSKDRLIVRYGAEIGLPDLLNRIAADLCLPKTHPEANRIGWASAGLSPMYSG